jgi:hypothetical protein
MALSLSHCALCFFISRGLGFHRVWYGFLATHGEIAKHHRIRLSFEFTGAPLPFITRWSFIVFTAPNLVVHVVHYTGPAGISPCPLHLTRYSLDPLAEDDSVPCNFCDQIRWLNNVSVPCVRSHRFR